MEQNIVPAEELLRVESIVTSLQELDATDEGRAALEAAQAGLTWPDAGVI